MGAQSSSEVSSSLTEPDIGPHLSKQAPVSENGELKMYINVVFLGRISTGSFPPINQQQLQISIYSLLFFQKIRLIRDLFHSLHSL